MKCYQIQRPQEKWKHSKYQSSFYPCRLKEEQGLKRAVESSSATCSDRGCLQVTHITLKKYFKQNGRSADQWKVMFLNDCSRWLSSCDIEAVSSAAGRCLLCQQASTLILLEAEDVLDHTHSHTNRSRQVHPHIMWHSSSVRHHGAFLFALFSFTLINLIDQVFHPPHTPRHSFCVLRLCIDAICSLYSNTLLLHPYHHHSSAYSRLVWRWAEMFGLTGRQADTIGE